MAKTEDLPEINLAAPPIQQKPLATEAGQDLPEVYIEALKPSFRPADKATDSARTIRSVLRGTARAVGMPADLTNAAANLWAGGMERYNPFYWPRGARLNLPGSRELIDIGERRGIIPRTIDDTPMRRMESAAVEEAVAALGGQGMLSPLSKFGPKMAKIFGWGDDPLSTAGIVGTSGAVGGVGGEVAAGVDPGLRPYGQLIGGLSPLAAMGLYRAAKAHSPLNPEQQKRTAGSFVQGVVDDPANVLNAKLSDYGVSGFSTTLGRASDDPGLLRIEKGLLVSDPIFANIVDNMQLGNRAAMRQHLEQSAPNADPFAPQHLAVEKVNLGRTRRANQVADARQQAERRVNAARQALAPQLSAMRAELDQLNGADPQFGIQLSREESSAAVEAAMQQARQGAKDEAGRLYDLAKQYEDVVLPVDSLVDLRNTLQADAVKRGWTTELPKLLRTPVDDQGQRIADVTLDDFLLSGQGAQVQGLDQVSPIMSAARLEGLRGLVRKRLRELGSQGLGESPESGYLKQLSGGIDKIFDSVGDGAVPWVPAEMATAYKNARTFYGSEYKPLFGGRTSLGSGLDARQPTTFMAPLFKKGPEGGVLADQLVKAGGADEAVRQYVLDMAARVTTNKNGLVSVDKLSKFNADYSEFLQRFPAVRDELLQTQAAQSAINARREQLKASIAETDKASAAGMKQAEKEAEAIVKAAEHRQAYFESPVVRDRWAARYFLDRDPERAVRAILASKDRPKAIKQTMELLRQDPSGEALAGFQRAYMDSVLDRVLQRSENAGVKAGTLTKVLDAERELVDTVLTSQQRKALNDVLTAANVDLRQSRRAAISGGSGTPEGLQAANTINDLISLKLGGQFSGRVLWLLNRVGMTAGQESVKMLLREAMLDPAVMRELLTIPTKPNLNMQLSNRIVNLLGRASSSQESKPAP